ncbi:putative major facilitator, sugar transporter, major facilitator superfamily [Rosa chinensis]|uniref:Putative major facilitator, sugar transporter, major facilitator superfamily n=1 Tax=Rosa chinensis TaxID=74649 RepID=A0A2P6PHK9_ROSCH|nr:sugar transport protein 5 [Rosa chinensis]PRQ21420.1 putative major facilitator, sugar transporter, major facilitator superfamily [Rosa chinensis]
MAGGGFAVVGPVTGINNGRITLSVVITCIVAASCGLIFGYDIGISGGVTTMPPFLRKFFPSILRKESETKPNIYCVYDSQLLTLFTSSLYLAGLAASLVASRLTKILGRRNIMLLGGSTFLVGAALNGGAVNIAMLILGRILLGFGVGFTNQSAPIYLSEVAPPKWRGAFNTGFQFFIGIGVLAANCINYATSKHEHGWRFSLGLAIVPAAIMTFGAVFISDSPSSLVERNKLEQAKKALIHIRGKDTDIEPELALLIKNSEIAKAINEEPFMIIFQRQYRPQLVIGMIAIPFFQQVTGINIIAFYAPVLFQSVGFGNDSALIAAIILGMVNLVSILVSSYAVDRYGRRILFLQGGIQMFITQVGVAIVLALTTGTDGTKHITKGYAILVLVLMCFYAAGFGWSWGPLSWLVPSEIYPLKIRPIGQSMGVGMNFATTFVLSQTFLSMLCHFKYGTFLFYGGWIFAMTIFVALFLPETKGIPLDLVHTVWEKHWYWRRFVQSKPEDTINHDA